MADIQCFASVCTAYIDESVLLLQYFGGTNFGRTSGGPFYITSYDYDAPLDEYGACNLSLAGKQIAKKKYHYLLRKLCLSFTKV